MSKGDTTKETVAEHGIEIKNIKENVKGIKKHLWVLQFGVWGLVLVLVGTGVLKLEDIPKLLAYIF